MRAIGTTVVHSKVLDARAIVKTFLQAHLDPVTLGPQGEHQVDERLRGFR